MTKKKQNFLEEKDYKGLQEYHIQLGQAKIKLADLFIHQQDAAMSVLQLEQKFGKFKEGLEYKYGPGIAVDMADGSFLTKEEQDELGSNEDNKKN